MQKKEKYFDLLVKYSKANKFGQCKNFAHIIHLKDNVPVYRKQFPIQEAHTDFIEATLENWIC